ncbi:hypothetical protein NLJ89_g9566 [Agrocybe chaxingu]|uniref:SAP domain-containing protein n=1 Tax=Agrocybe chaxingu TaxID=84603 RepID=A0A9W8JTB9_9AGAR|nr:hypothetical protein NLJ89_g9566 [Agrocybe chaxingu]
MPEQASSSTRSAIQVSHGMSNLSPTPSFTFTPQRRAAEETRRLDKLLHPPPALASREFLTQQNALLRAEAMTLREQRNQAQSHAILIRQEYELMKLQTHGKENKKKRKGVRVNAELVTSREARQRREAERAEREAKEKKKADAKAQRAAQAAEARERRDEIRNDPHFSFSGALTSKKKDQLVDIIVTLGLTKDGTKNALIERINKHFDDHPELKSSPHYSGLFNHRPCCSGPNQAEPEDPPPLATRPAPQPIAGPSRSHHDPPPRRYSPYPTVSIPPASSLHTLQTIHT